MLLQEVKIVNELLKAFYSLQLSHYGDEADMSIRLETPMQLGTITWPNSTAGNKL